jgi:hypothetical protein
MVNVKKNKIKIESTKEIERKINNISSKKFEKTKFVLIVNFDQLVLTPTKELQKGKMCLPK